MSRLHKHTFYIENLQQFTSSHERGALKVIQQHKNKNTSPTCKKLTVKFPRPRGAVLINKIQIGLSYRLDEQPFNRQRGKGHLPWQCCRG